MKDGTVKIPFVSKLGEQPEKKLRVLVMYTNPGGVPYVKWAIDNCGNEIPGTRQYFDQEIEKQKQILPRMDRIMRYGNA